MAESHVVQQGEYLAKIAKQYGFRNWHAIYDYPQNASLRKKRPNPNMLFPGDVLYIPPLEPKTLSRPTGTRHVFILHQHKVKVKMVLKGHDGAPMKDLPYTLDVGGSQFRGKTDSQGVVEHEIAVDSTEGQLTLEDFGLKVPVKVGDLDPIADADSQNTVISGIQARLNNLGFYCGEADGILGPRTQAALASFQQTVMGREDADGEPDQETKDKLLSAHGC